MTDLGAARWLISGRVQGVGFRWFVYRTAERLGLRGWARNLPDGRVEVVAAGASDALGRLDGALREGPLAAHVENVEKYNVSPEDIMSKSFDIN